MPHTIIRHQLCKTVSESNIHRHITRAAARPEPQGQTLRKRAISTRNSTCHSAPLTRHSNVGALSLQKPRACKTVFRTTRCASCCCVSRFSYRCFAPFCHWTWPQHHSTPSQPNQRRINLNHNIQAARVYLRTSPAAAQLGTYRPIAFE